MRHSSTTQSQRGAKKQPCGREPGLGAPPGMPRSSCVAAHLGDRLDQPARVGVRGAVEERRLRPELDQPSRVQERDAIGEVGDHGEVVADVEGGDAVREAEVAHRGEHVRLRRDVEAGRRLVEHEHPGAAGERHGEADALLLAARELMGIAALELVVRRQRDLAERLRDACAPLAVVRPDAVELQHLEDLLPDPQVGVEGGARILRHVGHRRATQRAQLVGAERRRGRARR